jgi:hypothetical protein
MTPLHQEPLVPRNGIALLPVVDLLGRPVVGRIDLRVAVPAVGLHLDEARSFAATGAADRLVGRLVGEEEVVAVDGEARHAVGLRAVRDVLERDAHARGDRLRPEVVLHDEDAGELVNAREVQGFVHT